MTIYIVLNGSQIVRAYKSEEHARLDAKWSQKDSVNKNDKFQVMSITTED